MEAKIFSEGNARLTDSAVTAFIISEGFEPPKHLAWHEGQFDQSLDPEENKALPFDLPAITWEFLETPYTKGNGGNQEGNGQFILHIAQRRMVDGVVGMSTAADHDKLIRYADLIIDILNGRQLDCSAKIYMVGVEKDHTNRPYMVDKVKFTWTGRRHRRAGVPD